MKKTDDQETIRNGHRHKRGCNGKGQGRAVGLMRRRRTSRIFLHPSTRWAMRT